jgi:hypothetical protein
MQGEIISNSDQLRLHIAGMTATERTSLLHSEAEAEPEVAGKDFGQISINNLRRALGNILALTSVND